MWWKLVEKVMNLVYGEVDVRRQVEIEIFGEGFKVGRG